MHFSLMIPDSMWQHVMNIICRYDGHFELWDRNPESFFENDGAVQTGQGMSRP